MSAGLWGDWDPRTADENVKWGSHRAKQLNADFTTCCNTCSVAHLPGPLLWGSFVVFGPFLATQAGNVRQTFRRRFLGASAGGKNCIQRWRPKGPPRPSSPRPGTWSAVNSHLRHQSEGRARDFEPGGLSND